MSILEGHLDLLASQAIALPRDKYGDDLTAKLNEAVSMSISLFEMIEDRAAEHAAGESVSLCGRWLGGAGAIKERITAHKAHVPSELRQRFMRAYLRAKSVTHPVDSTGRKAIPLIEVESELLNRS